MDFEQVLAVTGKPQALSLQPKEAAATPEPVAPSPAEPVPAAAAEKSDKNQKQEVKPVKAGAKKGFNWTMVIILVVVVNLIVMLGGWFGYKFWKKRQAKELQEVEAGVQT